MKLQRGYCILRRLLLFTRRPQGGASRPEQSNLRCVSGFGNINYLRVNLELTNSGKIITERANPYFKCSLTEYCKIKSKRSLFGCGDGILSALARHTMHDRTEK